MNPNSKTILYVTYDGLSDPVSQSQVLPYLEKLSQNGISYHILSFEKKERLAKNEDKIWEKIEKIIGFGIQKIILKLLQSYLHSMILIKVKRKLEKF